MKRPVSDFLWTSLTLLILMTGLVAQSKAASSLPSWAVPYGNEFWQQADGSSAPYANHTAGPSLGNVIERVSHAWCGNGQENRFEVNARTYHATFYGHAIRFRPYRHTVASTSVPALEVESTFRTVAVRRGRQTFYQSGNPECQSFVVGNVAQVLLDAEHKIVEHFESRADGLAVAWVIGYRLPGQGALIIDAEVGGLAFHGETASGRHFADVSGTARVRVGNVTAVDASGKSWPVPTGARDNILSITVPAEVLSQAAYPLAIDPVISPEFGMDEPVTIVAPATTAEPVVTSNGTNYLVVWREWRDPNAPQIFGARVTSGGVVLDPNGLLLGPGNYGQAKVGSNGRDYLVVWDGEPIAGARVTSDGQVLTVNAFPSASRRPVAVSSDGTNFFVLWSQAGVRGARVTNSGLVLDPNGITISSSGGSPAAAFNGSDYLVAWWQSSAGNIDVFGARVTPAGVVTDTNAIPICQNSADQGSPGVATDGTDFLVVWPDYRANAASAQIWGARVSASGEVLDAGGFAIDTAPASHEDLNLLYDGASYLVLWSERVTAAERELRWVPLAAGGVVGIAKTFPTRLSNSGWDAAANGSQWMAVWRHDSGNVFGVRVDATGEALDANGININARTESNRQIQPAAAFDGTNYLVVWVDNRNLTSLPGTGLDIYGSRVNRCGVSLDPSGIAISRAASDQLDPAIAFNGANWLVVWSDARDVNNFDIYGTRVTSGGVVLEPDGIPIRRTPSVTGSRNLEFAPAVAANRDQFLVLWHRDFGFYPEIWGARVDAAGTVLDPAAIPISTITPDSFYDKAFPAVASNGEDYLAVWTDARNQHVTGGTDIYGSRVGRDGAVLDPLGFGIAMAAASQASADVASDGTNYFVVWGDQRNFSASGDDIYGSRVSREGMALDTNGIAISRSLGAQNSPAVARLRNDFFVSWADGRNSASAGIDVYGARVRSDGVLVDASAFAINRNPGAQSDLEMTLGPEGEFLVVSSGPQEGVNRIGGNLVALPYFEIAPPTNLTIRIRPDPAAAPSTNATFCVTTSIETLAYQWQFNGVDIPDATNLCVTITGVQLENGGEYRVTVSDSNGPVVSASAVLTPLITPVIIQPPTSQSVVAGGSATFSVAVTGSPLPFGFEWRQGPTPKTSNTVSRYVDFFTLSNAQPSQAGTWRVVVKNLANISATGQNRTFTLTVLSDNDRDGLADQWEVQHALNTNDLADAAVDSDGDTLTNLQEYIAGTDPRDDQSYLKIDRLTHAGSTLVSFTARSNKTYTVQRSDRLGSAGSWSKLADIIAQSTNRTETVVDHGNQTERYYRLETPRQP